MCSSTEMGRLVRRFNAVKSRITEACTRVFKSSPPFTTWTLVRVMAIGALMLAGAAMYFNMTSEGVVDKGLENDYAKHTSAGKKPEKAAEGAEQTLAYPSEDFWMKVDRRAVGERDNAWNVPKELPQRNPGLHASDRRAVQQKLIGLGFATMEGEEFQASVAEADDAGHGQLLLQAGFTAQQIRNAQGRQRKAYEEAGAEAWFRLLASIRALAELRRQGFADLQGNVNVAAAYNAGLGNLLLHAGLTETQVRDAQR